MNIRIIDESICVIEHEGFNVQVTFEFSGPDDACAGVLTSVTHDEGTVLRTFLDDPVVRLPEVHQFAIKSTAVFA